MADIEKQLQKLIKVGGDMGLHGKELRNWADKKIEDERQAKKEEREALTFRIKEEREKIQDQAALAREQAAIAREQATLAEKQLQLERLRSSNGASPGSSPSTSEGQPNRNVGVKSPRLPCYEESRDQIDSYLLRFERYATVNNWSLPDGAIHLSALLRGKALDVY